VTKKEESGNYILVTDVRFLALILALTLCAAAPTAILECVSATRKGADTIFEFRTGAAANIQPTKATLVLHFSAPQPPRRLRVNGKSLPVYPEKEGWAFVPVEPKWAARPLKIRTEGAGLDGPANSQYAPYLVVEGGSAAK
jgi:hypothetical protein